MISGQNQADKYNSSEEQKRCHFEEDDLYGLFLQLPPPGKIIIIETIAAFF